MSATKDKLMEFYKELTDFIDTYEERMVHTTLRHRTLIKAALDAQKTSLTFKTAVGAAVKTNDGKIFIGANIESITRSSDIHAEILAITKALQSECKPGYKREEIMAIVVTYGAKVPARPDIEGGYAYPMCAICRQFAWENTHPDLEVIVVDPDATVIFAGPLKILYPLPYPSKVYERLNLRN